MYCIYSDISLTIIILPPDMILADLMKISFYHGTMTKDAFFSKKYGILQLLDKDQKDLVRILGKRSGYEAGYDKQRESERVGYAWTEINTIAANSLFANGLDDDEARNTFDGMKVLPRCQSYLKLKMINTMEGGDHELALCQVLGVGQWDARLNCAVDVQDYVKIEPKDEQDVLYTGYLRQEGVI